MQAEHLPNPKRFQVYTQIPNGKGFRIKDSKYIYMFDKFGGFYDEYNNYYNQDGEPEESPSDEDQDFQRTVLEDQFDQDDYDDYYEKEYGANNHDDFDDYEDEINHKSGINPNQKILQAIAHNTANLHDYPLKTPLRVDFDNMSFKATKQQILKHYRSKVGKGILNVILTKQDGKFIGQGYFVCDNVSTAEKLVKYENEDFQGRPVRFDVETVQNFLVDPVTRDQTGITINQEEFQSLVKQQPKVQLPKEESKKKYAPKTKTQVKNQPPKNVQSKVQPKVQSKQSPVKQEKSSPVNQVKPVQQVKPQEPTWSKYQGQVTMFPKKTSFKQWMAKLGFKENEHFKNPQKTQSKDPNKKFATVELRSDVYLKIEQSLYEGKKVHFEKIN